jgi:hypothetical protein
LLLFVACLLLSSKRLQIAQTTECRLYSHTPLVTQVVDDAEAVCPSHDWSSLEPVKQASILIRLQDLFAALEVRGVLMLLGNGSTVGSIDVFPPSRHQLLRSFNEPHSVSALLSVGARALTKHFHRGIDRFWGEPLKKGGDAVKNAHAEALLQKILGSAVWVNVHCIVHNVPLLEVRNADGYGARWTADGSAFRGFLEPPMADGHDKGTKCASNAKTFLLTVFFLFLFARMAALDSDAHH